MQIACKDILRDIISKGKFVMGITFLKNAFFFSPIEKLNGDAITNYPID